MQIKANPQRKVVKAAAYLCSVVVTAFIFYFVFSYYLPSPRETAMTKEMEQLKAQYDALNTDVNDMIAVMDNMKDRDSEVYELLLGAQPIDKHIWHGGIGGHDIEGEALTEEVNMTALTNSLEEMERKIVLHSKYLDDVETAAAEDDSRRRHIPSIRPVQMAQSDTYVHMLSGFGMRKHPVHKVNKMHKGIDFPARKGTPVIATGDGTVVSVKRKRTGYGRSVEIDHGFGYTSLYAHLDDISVKRGDVLKRGEQVGTIGRTGTATAPHVHYEVRLNDRAINPIHYCMDGLSPEEFSTLLKASCQHNHSFD